MKVVLLSSLALLLSTLTWVSCEPPTVGYAHNSYDDPYAEMAPSHGHSPYHHSQSHHSHHHHQPQPGPHEHHEHEVIIQQHHHPIEEAPVKVIQHGHQDPPAHYARPTAGVSTSYKAAGGRVRAPHPNSYGHHSSSHGYHSAPPSPSYTSSSYNKVPAAMAAYDSPQTDGGSLNAGYSSYKSNDYKAYAAHTPASHADDYGQSENYGDSYGHSSYNSPPPPPPPSSHSYKGAGQSYSPPSSAYGNPMSSHSPAYSSYASGYEHEPSHSSAPAYRPKAKGYRTPYSGHSTSSGAYGSPSYASSYGVPSKGVYSMYGGHKGSTYALKASSPYSQAPKLTYPVSTPLKSAYGPPKSSYGAPPSSLKASSYGAPKTYYRTSQWKGYKSPSYGAAAPSYSYGSPASKGFGYSPMSYSAYESADKGSSSAHQLSSSVNAYDDSPEPASMQDDYPDPYSGGAYDNGSSPY